MNLFENQLNPPLDRANILWFINYFLQFVPELKLNVKRVDQVLTKKVLSYLTFVACTESEQVEIQRHQQQFNHFEPHLRRIRFSVGSIHRFLFTLNFYIGQGNSQMIAIRNDLVHMKELRHLFPFWLRIYDPKIQCRQYLRDVIVAHHVLLSTLDATGNFNRTDLEDHLKNFCSKKILSRYGTVLEDYKKNGVFVNNCVLTIFHHVFVDLDRVDLLLDPAILQPFHEILNVEQTVSILKIFTLFITRIESF